MNAAGRANELGLEEGSLMEVLEQLRRSPSGLETGLMKVLRCGVAYHHAGAFSAAAVAVASASVAVAAAATSAAVAVAAAVTSAAVAAAAAALTLRKHSSRCNHPSQQLLPQLPPPQ